MLNKFKSLKIFQSDTTTMQLIRTYIVGAINLIIGLSLSYIFQFWVLTFISFPLRTYVTNVCMFLIGVVISYYLSRRIIFKLSFTGGTLKEYLNFLYTNLIMYLIHIWRCRRLMTCRTRWGEWHRGHKKGKKRKEV